MSQEIRQLAHVASVLVDNIHSCRAQVGLHDYAPARVRWLTAIRKVQNINMVNKVRVRLDAIAKRDARKAAKDKQNDTHPRILRRTFDHQPSEGRQVASPFRRPLLKPATLPHIQVCKEEGAGDRTSPSGSPLRRLQRSSTAGVECAKRRERALTFEPSPTSTAGMQRLPFHDRCDGDKLLSGLGLSSSSSGTGSTTGRDSPSLAESFVHIASRSPRPVSRRAYDPSYPLAVTMKCDLPSP